MKNYVVGIYDKEDKPQELVVEAENPKGARAAVANIATGVNYIREATDEEVQNAQQNSPQGGQGQQSADDQGQTPPPGGDGSQANDAGAQGQGVSGGEIPGSQPGQAAPGVDQGVEGARGLHGADAAAAGQPSPSDNQAQAAGPEGAAGDQPQTPAGG